MNSAYINLWIPLAVKGQRKCRVEFTINTIGSEFAYSLTKVNDVWTGDDYPIKDVVEWNSEKDICRNIDIATHGEWAKAELGVDLSKLRGPQKGPPPPIDKNQTTMKFT